MSGRPDREGRRRGSRERRREKALAERKRRRAREAARAGRAEERRRQILEAAIRVVRRRGPDVSMEEIAAEAGITKPIVYRAFGDREGLTDAVAEDFAQDVLGRIEEALSRGGRTFRQALAETIDAYLAFVEQEPQIVRFLVARELGSGLPRLMRLVCARVAREIGEALRGLGLDSGAAEPWADAIVGGVHLAGERWLEDPSMPRSRLVDYLTALLWDGMRHFARPSAEGASRQDGQQQHEQQEVLR